jgi:hypothetical protein
MSGAYEAITRDSCVVEEERSLNCAAQQTFSQPHPAAQDKICQIVATRGHTSKLAANDGRRNLGSVTSQATSASGSLAVVCPSRAGLS